MNAHARIAFACLLAAVLASSVSAQGSMPASAAEVTDAQIATVQASMEGGCVRRGLERRHPDDRQLHDGCACTVAVARVQITQQEWRDMVMAGVTNDGPAGEAILAAHKDAMMVCWPKP